MKSLSILLLFILLASSTCISNAIKKDIQTLESHEITCTDSSCFGKYIGKEFVNGSDIAHQFSNKMSKAVGDKLKELYTNGKYSKVDLANIHMSTKGMGTGTVTYELNIPFVSVSNKCEARTSFDHSGGWNHSPAIKTRKERLLKVVLPGDSLDISPLKTTPEGLQEYWIQWRNNEIQADCLKN
jgi:hypothetical protein